LRIARIAYINGTKKPFSPFQAVGLPRGYVITRRYFSVEQVKANIAIAISLSMKRTGFGDMIDKNNPFIIALVGDLNDQNYSVAKMMLELSEIVPNYQGRVIICGFDVKIE